MQQADIQIQANLCAGYSVAETSNLGASTNPDTIVIFCAG
jgi:hypothetical protein